MQSRIRAWGIFFAVLNATLLLGCAEAPLTSRRSESERGGGLLWSGTAREASLGTSVAGISLESRTFGQGPEAVLILATIHGNEPAGTPLMEEFEARLRGNPELFAMDRITLTLVKVANPDGYANGKRTNTRGVDLNRNFPADNFAARARHGEEPLSEPESRALHDLILALRPTRVLSFHQPLKCIDYDGPAKALARRLAELSGLPLKKLGSRPGSLGAWCGETLQIPIITWEFAGGVEHQSRAALWQRYGAAVLAFIHGEESDVVTGPATSDQSTASARLTQN